MYHLRGETTIARSIADVFAFLSDMENDPLWCSEVRETRRSSEEGAGGTGAAYDYVVRVGPVRMEGKNTISVHEPPRRMAWTSLRNGESGGGSYDLAPVDSGTRLVFRASVSLGGLCRPLEPLVRLYGQGWRVPHMLRTLKRRLEAS